MLTTCLFDFPLTYGPILVNGEKYWLDYEKWKKLQEWKSWYYKPRKEYIGDGLLEQTVSDRDYTSQ